MLRADPVGPYQPMDIDVAHRPNGTTGGTKATNKAGWGDSLDTAYNTWGRALLGDSITFLRDMGRNRASAANALVMLAVFALIGGTAYQYISEGELIASQKMDQVVGKRFYKEEKFTSNKPGIPLCTCGEPVTVWADIAELNDNLTALLKYNADGFADAQCNNLIYAGIRDLPGPNLTSIIVFVFSQGFNQEGATEQMMLRYRHEMCKTMVNAILLTVNATYDAGNHALGLAVQTPLLSTTPQLQASWNATIGALLQNLIWSFQGTIAAQAEAYRYIVNANIKAHDPQGNFSEGQSGAKAADSQANATIDMALTKDFDAMRNSNSSSSSSFDEAATDFWTKETLVALNTLLDRNVLNDMFSARFGTLNFRSISASQGDIGSEAFINIPGNDTLVQMMLEWTLMNIHFNWTTYERSCAATYCTFITSKGVFSRVYEFGSVVGGLWNALLGVAIVCWAILTVLDENPKIIVGVPLMPPQP